ncbi:MAG: hypothetical protein HC896_17125 [Bacteroidales bacterium]|nr:hypothetical protein [Bacteroidales bacterium]
MAADKQCLIRLMDHLSEKRKVLENNKYANHYEYARNQLALAQVEHFDTGNLLLTRNTDVKPAIGIIKYKLDENLNDKGHLIPLISAGYKATGFNGLIDFLQVA